MTAQDGAGRGEAFRRELECFDREAPIERASTPPASWYTDPAFLEAESRTVFRSNWVAVARTDQVERPGDYVTGTLAGEPWVVLRDETGSLTALSNVCRHHAAPVACGEGRLERLTCPYHGWTYRLDGSLASAPRMAGVRDFDRARLALPRLEVATFGPLVMLRQDPGREPGELDPLRERLDAVGFEGLRFVASRRHTLECNWKVFVDNYLDGGYHVPVLHAGLAGQLDLADYRTELFPRFSIQSCPGAREAASAAPGAAADFAERVGDRALYAWIHPATMINRYGPWMDVNRVVPLGPGGTEVVFDYYLHPDFTPEGAEADAFVERSLAASDRVQDEDRWISEAVQRGLASRAYERGRYAPRVEQAMHHFHGLLAADLARA